MESASLREIDVQVFPAYTGRVTKSWLRMVAGEALRSEDPDGSSAISLVIADDDTLRRLNLEFRGLDETTDVLAFPLEDAGHDQGPAGGSFPDFPDEASSMGEIVISYPQAKRQARQAKKPSGRSLPCWLSTASCTFWVRPRRAGGGEGYVGQARRGDVEHRPEVGAYLS